MDLFELKEKPLILLDNCSSHKTNIIKSWTMESGVELLFNIPYFPQSNPVEQFFANLKQKSKGIFTTNH